MQGIIGLIVTIFFPAYIKKKAENLAQKEDLDEITRKVEQIKHDFGVKNEEIKAELSVITSAKLENKRYARDAIIKMVECLNDWFHVELDVGDVTFYKIGDDVSDKIIRIKLAHNKVSKQSSMLTLVVEEKPFIDSMFEAMEEIMNYSHFVENYLQKLSHHMKTKERLKAQNPNSSKMSDDGKKEFMRKYDEIHNAMVESRKVFSEGVRPLMNRAKAALTMFTFRAKQELDDLAKKEVTQRTAA